jgi:hypothetical protein
MFYHQELSPHFNQVTVYKYDYTSYQLIEINGLQQLTYLLIFSLAYIKFSSNLMSQSIIQSFRYNDLKKDAKIYVKNCSQ